MNIVNSNLDYMVVGLGNIGKEYELTRHNMGFMVLDTMSKRYNFEICKSKFQSLTCKTVILGKNVLFLKPSTYMNNSGQAVVEAINFYKINMGNVIVVYDDITIELGRIKIKKSGSDGGHNGIKNIIYLTGCNVFPRIKVGVSAKPNIGYTLADWVLSKFKDDEKELLGKAVNIACDGLECIIKNGVDIAINKYNTKESCNK